MSDRADDDLRTMVREFRASVSEELSATHRHMLDLSDELRQRIATTETAMLNALREQARESDRRFGRLEDRLAGVEDGLSGLGERFAGVEGRLSGWDDRLAGVEDGLLGLDERFSGWDERFSGVEGRLSGLDERVSGVVDRFSGLDRRVDGIQGDVAELTTGMTTLLEVVTDVQAVVRRIDEADGS